MTHPDFVLLVVGDIGGVPRTLEWLLDFFTTCSTPPIPKEETFPILISRARVFIREEFGRRYRIDSPYTYVLMRAAILRTPVTLTSFVLREGDETYGDLEANGSIFLEDAQAYENVRTVAIPLIAMSMFP